MMRKFFCKNDADDFEDLPAFNEDKIAGICAAVVAVAAITATIVCLLRKNKD